MTDLRSASAPVKRIQSKKNSHIIWDLHYFLVIDHEHSQFVHVRSPLFRGRYWAILKHSETCGECPCSRATQCDFLLLTCFGPRPDNPFLRTWRGTLEKNNALSMHHPCKVRTVLPRIGLLSACLVAGTCFGQAKQASTSLCSLQGKVA